MKRSDFDFIGPVILPPEGKFYGVMVEASVSGGAITASFPVKEVVDKAKKELGFVGITKENEGENEEFHVTMEGTQTVFVTIADKYRYTVD